MARTDWIALITQPAAEYVAHVELTRYGLDPYLPQIRRYHRDARANAPLLRASPLFPRYLLMPLRQVDYAVLRVCRGLDRIHPLLTDWEGRPWRVPAHVIDIVRAAEGRGEFDEILRKGDKIRINNPILAEITAFVEDSTADELRVLTPLLGGARMRIARSGVTKL